MSNSMEPRAIIIVWQGKEVPEDIIARMISFMADSGAAIPEMVTVKQFDEEGLAKCLGSCINVNSPSIFDNKDLDPIYNAIVYIGTKYKECITNNSAFALRLSSDLSDEKYKRATGKPVDEGLLTAVEILSTKTVTSRYAPLLNEYGMKKSTLEVIHTAYHYHNHVFVS